MSSRAARPPGWLGDGGEDPKTRTDERYADREDACDRDEDGHVDHVSKRSSDENDRQPGQAEKRDAGADDRATYLSRRVLLKDRDVGHVEEDVRDAGDDECEQEHLEGRRDSDGDQRRTTRRETPDQKLAFADRAWESCDDNCAEDGACCDPRLGEPEQARTLVRRACSEPPEDEYGEETVQHRERQLGE